MEAGDAAEPEPMKVVAASRACGRSQLMATATAWQLSRLCLASAAACAYVYVYSELPATPASNRQHHPFMYCGIEIAGMSSGIA